MHATNNHLSLAAGDLRVKLSRINRQADLYSDACQQAIKCVRRVYPQLLVTTKTATAEAV